MRPPAPPEKIEQNLVRIRARIAESAQKSHRPPESIRLIAVTKYASNDETAALVNLGVKDFGESRVQDAEKKIAAVAGVGLRWHLIGHLQTNKASKAVKLFHTIHSVDSDRVARALNTEAQKIAKSLDCLIELNTAGEESKFGLPPNEPALFELLKICADLQSIRVTGLMSMAPYAEHPENSSREVFKRVRELFDSANAANAYPHPLTDLSMGMTQDFQIAIEEGATMVRIGSALFD